MLTSLSTGAAFTVTAIINIAHIATFMGKLVIVLVAGVIGSVERRKYDVCLS